VGGGAGAVLGAQWSWYVSGSTTTGGVSSFGSYLSASGGKVGSANTGSQEGELVGEAIGGSGGTPNGRSGDSMYNTTANTFVSSRGYRVQSRF